MASLAEQLYAFGVTIAAGAAMGAVFDLFRALRGTARPRGAVAWISDMLYWLSVTPLTAGLLLHANGGQLRLYVVLGVVIGLTVYFAALSPFVLETLRLLFRAVAGVVSWTARLILYAAAGPVMLGRRLAYAWRVRAADRARLFQAGWPAWLRPPWRPPAVWRPGPAWRRR